MNNEFMELALVEAKKAYKNEDIPVGAVAVLNGKVIAKAFNKKNKKKDPTCHAEILLIKKVCKKLRDFRLALLSARVKAIYFGAYDKKYSILELKNHIKFNHDCAITGGVMEDECSEILSKFFAELRRGK